MKKSIFKKIVSLLAVTAITITSSVVALAENDYASQSTTCDDKTNWSVYTDANQGVSGTIADGKAKFERSIFRVKNANKANFQGLENATASSDGFVYFTAGENGDWVATDKTTSNPTWTYTFADGKKFSKGRVQIKGDIMFAGGTNQTASIEFAGSTTVSWERVGVFFHKNAMRALYPNGSNGSYTNYPSAITDNEWYTYTIVYDINAQTIRYTLQKKDDASWTASGVASIPANMWTDSRKKGEVSGAAFVTYRDYDSPDATSETNKSSEWYVDNVSLDAYTESNYTAENIYKNGRGFFTNRYVEKTGASDIYSLQGVKVNRITGVNDADSVSLVTAAYDADGRMEDVEVTPISTVGDTPMHKDVAGATVKSFVLDMNTATPYMPAYTYSDPTNVYRMLDFSTSPNTWYDGFDSVKNADRWGHISTGGSAYTNGVKLSRVDNTLKFERSIFGSGSNFFTYDATEGKVISTTTKSHANSVGVAIGANVNKVTVSLRFKFAGVDHASGAQEIQIQPLGSGNRFVRITRNADGTGRVWAFFQGAGSQLTWLATDTRRMRADEWYEYTFTYDLRTKTLTNTLKGVFDNTGYEELNGTVNLSTSGIAAPTTMNMILFGIPADVSAPFPSTEVTTPTEFDIKTSVAYFDDLKIEYDTADIVQ